MGCPCTRSTPRRARSSGGTDESLSRRGLLDPAPRQQQELPAGAASLAVASSLLLLPGGAAVLATEVAHTGEVVTLALVPVEATHAPAGVKGPAELDRQLLVRGSGVQAAGHGSMVALALLARPEP